jgi:hypothetical protein
MIAWRGDPAMVQNIPTDCRSHVITVNSSSISRSLLNLFSISSVETCVVVKSTICSSALQCVAEPFDNVRGVVTEMKGVRVVICNMGAVVVAQDRRELLIVQRIFD